MINISRRGFLGGLLASGASALIGPSLLGRAVMAAESGDKLVQSGSHWGAFRARVVDGRWVETLPFEHDKHPTDMLKALSEVVYNPSRIRYPMVRLDWLRKGHQSDTCERGQNRFVRVTWSQALDFSITSWSGCRKLMARAPSMPATPAGSRWASCTPLAPCWDAP